MYIYNHITLAFQNMIKNKVLDFFTIDLKGFLLSLDISCLKAYSECTLTLCGNCSAMILVNIPSLIVIRGSLERWASFSIVSNAI